MRSCASYWIATSIRPIMLARILALSIVVATATGCVQPPDRETARQRALAARIAESPDCQKLLKHFAMAGDAEAQASFADCLYLGIGGPKNETAALQWYKKAADSGDLRAQAWLGTLYARGQGLVPLNLSRALAFLVPAAEAGQIDAQAELGRIYRQGHILPGTGIEPDAERAKYWLGRAAEKGHVWAKAALGSLLINEPPPLGDPEEGEKLLRAVLGERPETGVLLGEYLVRRAEEGEPGALNEALDLLQPLAESGDEGAMQQLSRVFHSDRLGRIDHDLSFSWADRAVREGGHPTSLDLLANHLLLGIGVEKDPARAYDLRRRAAEGGLAASQLTLGAAHLRGAPGVPRDLDQAIHWLKLADEQGRPEAPALLQAAIDARRGGLGRKRSPADVQQAAESGDPKAMVWLAAAHATGRHGLPQDKAASKRWLKAAAELGEPTAFYQLGLLEADWPILDPDQIKPATVYEGTRRALPLWEKAWAAGDVRAAALLGYSFFYGFGVTATPSRGMTYFRACAERGSAQCQFDLGRTLFSGAQGVKRDRDEGRLWLEAAAKQDHPWALTNLAVIHRKGIGVARDTDLARRFAERAAALGSTHAENLLREIAEEPVH